MQIDLNKYSDFVKEVTSKPSNDLTTFMNRLDDLDGNYDSETQTHDIQPYVNDGPFAKGLEQVTDTVKSTPGNIGGWLGYKIVCAYMDQHPKKTLGELIQEPIDAARFLDEARYKPR